jgi:hypothetical protein
MTSREIVEKITSDACIALFSDYALPLRPTQNCDDSSCRELVYCSVIGFSSSQMRGTLVLATSREPLGRTSPVQGGSLREWVAELSNQLLGRIKRHLAERGLILAISTPVVLSGQHLRPLPNKEAEPLIFECQDGCVCVWMDAEIAAELDLSHVQQDCQIMGEGEAMLF